MIVVIGVIVGVYPRGHDVPTTTTHPVTSHVVPHVAAVKPSVVRGRGGARLVLTGSGFDATTTVTVGGHTANVVSRVGSHELIAIAPAGFGAELVRAIDDGRASAAARGAMLHYATSILIVGDSLGIDLGWGFGPSLTTTDDLAFVDDSVGSSGLVRSDFYDWPAHLRAEIAKVHPDVVMTLFGTNDEQAIVTGGTIAEPLTPTWDARYAQRVRAIWSLVRASGATLLWVGLPRMGPGSVLSPTFVEGLIRLDRRTLSTERRTVFVDVWGLFTGAHGAYDPYVEVAPHVYELGHAPDGTHLTTAGATAIDEAAMAALARVLGP